MKKYQNVFSYFILIIFILFLGAGCDRHKYVKVKKEKISDIEMAYYTRGNGPPLVMIMGFRGTMAMWDPGLLEALEKNFTVILFDQRGVGLSTDTDVNQTTISQMADDTFHLVKALGYSKANILGWSMGSRIAEEIAISHPEILNTLILCSPNPGGKYQSFEKPRPKELTSLKSTREQIFSLIYPQTTLGESAASSYVERMTMAMMTRTIPDDLTIANQTIERQLNALIQWDEDSQHFEQLQNIKVPTLVAAGLADIIDPPENARLVAKQIPFAWSAYFKEAGHAFLFQDYEPFAQLVAIFINSNKTTS